MKPIDLTDLSPFDYGAEQDFDYIVTIRRVADGMERDFAAHWKGSLTGFEYMWNEGNYACDCNRARFFAFAGGEPEPEARCGEGAFEVVKARRG